VLKKKWFWIVMVLLLAGVVLAFSFWDVIVIYTAPKSVLSKALNNAMEDLVSRFESSPVSILSGHLDSKGQYTGVMRLQTSNPMLGPVNYDMTVRADTHENRISAEGVVCTEQNDLDMSVYLDREFMALSSEDLLKGAYYGITYKTFPEDIRSIPLISMFIGENVLTQWDASVSSIAKSMNATYQAPEVPQLSSEDVLKAMTAVMLLPSKVEQVEMPVWGVTDRCYRISYSAKGEQVGQVLGYLMDAGDGSDAQVIASFYIWDEQLLMMHVQGNVGDNSIRCALEFMDSPVTRTIRFAIKKGMEEEGFCLRHKAQSSDGYLHETWSMYPNFEAAGEGNVFQYRWEPTKGEMVISAKPSVTLNISETEDGLQIQTDHFEWLLDAVSGDTPDPDAESIACTIQLKKGAVIATPEYKNLSQWSLDDLLVLLGGFGSLIGIPTA